MSTVKLCITLTRITSRSRLALFLKLVNVEFIRQLGPKSCVLKDGREILLSRKNTDEIHAAYAAYVFSQLSKRDGASPEGTKR